VLIGAVISALSVTVVAGVVYALIKGLIMLLAATIF